MALPAQVQKQSERVQQLYREMNEDPNDKNEEVVTEPVLEKVDDGHSAVTQKPNEQVSGSQELQAEQQKYRTLQGMYNADMERFKGRVSQLEKLLSDLSAAAPKKEEEKKKEPVKHITKEDEDEYGDSIPTIRRVHREEVAALEAQVAELAGMVSQMQKTVVPQLQHVAQRQHVSADQKFWADLEAIAPKWRDVNSDEKFQDWLLSPDPLTGINRQTYLDAAQRDLDANRVSAFFKMWEGQSGNPGANTEVRNPNDRQQELRRQIEPGRGRTKAPDSQEKPKYTSEDIKQFYADVRTGKYRGNDAERGRIEADIFAAQREGRLVQAR